MRKIPTIFERDDATNRRYVTDKMLPECVWVLEPGAIPTRKYDGTCVLVDESHVLWARREVRPDGIMPPNFTAVEHDSATGKTVGWEPAEQSGFARYIEEASDAECLPPGTYELCGPKINRNPEGLDSHRLLRHGLEGPVLPAGFWDDPGRHLHALGWEGIVWHHADGRMAKLKARDYPRPDA